ncbi:thiolase [Tilletiaria anomala UBC 951]|uniref:acetyl-CoA C-acetyltransferase n=1 Tax=Tilletiaria anomala (strain ATCC 24038 / CBS 436.72 / UBC 951) TaxID=1037660 RepID=A0A066VW14_TILAU|nr:thiolase [Tilletiaria anomala UBC 951]KDN42745.1 thiolase [Tilletiaria anomala UBC 951]
MSFAPSAVRRLTQTTKIMSNINDVFIVSATRTPIGSFNGALKKLTAPELGTFAVKAAIERANLKPEHIEDVYLGNVISGNVGQAPARQVVIASGCPETTEATTINKVCASGMKAISLAAQNIMLGQRGIMVAGGMESMSNAPYYIPRNSTSGFGHGQLLDALAKDGLTDVYNKFPMGNCAEKTAKDYSLSREDQDAYAIESYKRAADAWKAGAFKDEIVPVVIADKKGSVTVDEDEEYKNVKLEKIPSLRPVFDAKGTVTAANASTINDGASAVVLASEAEVKKHGLKPLAKIISFADAACAPIDFPVAPAKAIPLALERAGLKKEDIALWEINEAFSAVALANNKILGLDASKVNTLGGGVSLGHPIGSSGCRIVVTLAHSLKPGEYGCAGVCNGGGGASAIVIKREA